MNLIKYMRVGATLLAIAASVSPICAMQPGQYGPNGPAYVPNATGTYPRSASTYYNTQPYYGSSSDESLLGTFTNWVTGATRKINETANNVRQKRSEVNQNSPTNATANLTGELKAAQVEVKSSMTALEEAGSAFRGFFGMLPGPWTMGAAVAGYNDSRTKETSKGDTGFESEHGGQSTWIQAGKDRWMPDGKATAGDLFKADVMKKVKDDVVPFFMKGGKPDAVKIGGAAITALLTAAVFKEEITGAVKSIARKLLPARFFKEKPATSGILFSDLSPEQQKHVQKQMGIMGTAPQSIYSYPVSGQQNAFQYNLNAKASKLYQKGWFGYSRKR